MSSDVLDLENSTSDLVSDQIIFENESSVEVEQMNRTANVGYLATTPNETPKKEEEVCIYL